MLDNIKCQLCEQRAKISLRLNENIHCEHCGYLKYDTNEKLILCELECPNLYWWPCDHTYNNKTNVLTASYCMEKDECNNCGKRDFQEALFIGSQIYHEICDFCCNKPARYKLALDNDICCSECNKIKHKKNIKLTLCSTQCENNPWKIVEYLTKKKNKNVKLIYQISNDECYECMCSNDSMGIFTGTKIAIL
jgi:hypothetical protein